MSTPTVELGIFPASCACHSSLHAHVSIQDVGKDGGDHTALRPLDGPRRTRSDHRLPGGALPEAPPGLGHLKAHSSPIVTRQAKAAVRCPRVRADRSPADRAAVPPASAPLRRKRAVAHDVEGQFSTVVTPALGAGHPGRSRASLKCPWGEPAFSPKISEVKATDQQRPAQAPGHRMIRVQERQLSTMSEAPFDHPRPSRPRNNSAHTSSQSATAPALMPNTTTGL